MKIKHLLFFIPVTFLVACEGTDLIEPDNVSKEQISTQIIYNPTKYSKQKGDVFVKSSLPTTMAKQIPNACVTSIMEYANNKVFGGTVNVLCVGYNSNTGAAIYMDPELACMYSVNAGYFLQDYNIVLTGIK